MSQYCLQNVLLQFCFINPVFLYVLDSLWNAVNLSEALYMLSPIHADRKHLRAHLSPTKWVQYEKSKSTKNMWQEPCEWWSHSAYGANQKTVLVFLAHYHSEGHLDRKILRPQWDLVAPRKNPFSMQIKQDIYDSNLSSTRSMCVFMETTGFIQTSYYYLGFRSKVSEVKRRS